MTNSLPPWKASLPSEMSKTLVEELVAVPVTAQEENAAGEAAKANPRVSLETSKGTIVIELFAKEVMPNF